MNDFLTLSSEERLLIINNAADKLNLSPAIVEKDYWVCWMLEYLFNSFKYKDFICFKGGTSLSKTYHLIQRFSEDIDLSLQWSALGIESNVPYLDRSNRQQEMFNREVNGKTAEFLKIEVLPILSEDFRKLLNDNFDLYIDTQTICFQYPQFFKDSAILSNLRLEIGVLAEPLPSDKRIVRSYIEEIYPNLFDSRKIDIAVVSPLRTFFEKCTILHREANRTNGNYPSRYS